MKKESSNSNKKYLSILSLGLIPLFTWANRQRGTDTHERFMGLPKLAFYGLLTLAILPFILLFHDSPLSFYWDLGATIVAIFAGLVIMFSPTWGECFPHTGDTSHEEFASGVKPITNWWAGYEYTSKTLPSDTLDWKTKAMSVRWMLYSVPLALSLSAVMWTGPLALLITPALIIVGYVYRYYFDKYINEDDTRPPKADPVEKSEYVIGGYLGVLFAVMIIAHAMLLY